MANKAKRYLLLEYGSFVLNYGETCFQKKGHLMETELPPETRLQHIAIKKQQIANHIAYLRREYEELQAEENNILIERAQDERPRV